MKSIGVIGGIGPQATMSFVNQLHSISQQLIPANKNSGYPPILTYYHRNPPMKVDDQGKPIEPHKMDPELIDKIQLIGNKTDLLVITSNYPHIFKNDFLDLISAKFISMVDEVIRHTRSANISKVGVLGLGSPTVYTDRLEKLNIQSIILPTKLMVALDKAIFAVMEGKNSGEENNVASEAINFLKNKKVEKIILGCTELPFLIPKSNSSDFFIDPLSILARKVMQEAIS